MTPTAIQNWDFNFRFDHMKQAGGRIVDKKYLIWPVNHFRISKKNVIYIQIEHNQAGKISKSG
jgi:hypothetical protein